MDMEYWNMRLLECNDMQLQQMSICPMAHLPIGNESSYTPYHKYIGRTT